MVIRFSLRLVRNQTKIFELNFRMKSILSFICQINSHFLKTCKLSKNCFFSINYINLYSKTFTGFLLNFNYIQKPGYLVSLITVPYPDLIQNVIIQKDTYPKVLRKPDTVPSACRETMSPRCKKLSPMMAVAPYPHHATTPVKKEKAF